MLNKLFIALLFFYFHVNAQELLSFQVNTGDYDRIDCPIAIKIQLDNHKWQAKNFQLVEVGDFLKKSIPFQFDENDTNKLWFILHGFTPKHTIRNFVIIHESTKENIQQINLIKKDGALQLIKNNNPILNYHYKIVVPPKGVDEKYKKSGFIHPLWSPNGEILTRIQPSDHYHHYGIWGPWTKTHINNRQVDFWNLAKGQGTVLFKSFKNEIQGNIYSGFTALQEYIDFGASSENRVALNEDLQIKVWNLNSSKKNWLIDYTTKIKSPLKSGILFDAYRYGGGIGFRATEKWNKDNTSVLTSENKDRSTADGSRGKWVIVEGASETPEGKSGILFMSHPKNRQFPEPMRVWPEDMNKGRGDLFFEFCPIRHVEWLIESQKEYRLKYRLLVYEGELKSDQAEIYWQGFANPPEIKINN